MASFLLPSLRRIAHNALQRPTSSLLRSSPRTRHFTDTAPSHWPESQDDSLSKPLQGPTPPRDPAIYRAQREESLRKLVAAGVLELPKPMEDLSEKEKLRIFARMVKELRTVSFTHDLPSSEERASPANPMTIRRCERLCAILGTALPFDKDTASQGEVSDALLRLAKRRYEEDAEPEGINMPEEDRPLPPTASMLRLADRWKIEYEWSTSRGELSDRIAEKMKELWRKRRAERGWG